MQSKYVVSVGFDESLRQGDILKVKVDKDKFEYGVIITADCDLAQKKHRGEVTYLKIISLRDYVESCWLVDEIFYKPEKSEVRKFRIALDEFRRSAGLKDVSDDALERMLNFEKEKFENLISPEKKLLERFMSLKKKKEAFDSYEGDGDIVLLASVLKGKTKEEIVSEGLSQIANSQPLDALFIGDYVFGENGLVSLRDIRHISINKIFFSNALFLDGKDRCALRVNRLRDIYKYSVTQMFGNLFSRIGLPEYHVNDKKAAAGLGV